MTITITPPSGSAVTLCHGPGRTLGNATGPEGYTLRCSPGLQKREFIEDKGPRYESVGLDEVSGSFSVVLRCASKSAAITAANAILSSTPRAGTLSLGGSISLYTCGITDIRADARGRAVYASYSFAGSLTNEVT